ncbi:MAG: hypothetical protein ACKPKO_23440, partial [Candidatus Fonsibacter sp.]
MGVLFQFVLAALSTKRPRDFLLGMSRHSDTISSTDRRYAQTVAENENDDYKVGYKIVNTEQHGIPQHL